MPRYRITVRRTFAAVVAAMAVAALAPNLSAEDAKSSQTTEKTTYDDHVQPILRKRCFTCHNADKKSGGLNMTSFTGLMQGGGSGEVVSPGSSGDSYLFMLITHQSQPNMPPGGGKIPDPEIDTIKKWIDGGALASLSSKPVAPKKPKFDFALKGAPIGKPNGPPPMPRRMGLEPVVHTSANTAVTALATSPWAPLVAVAGQKQVLLYHTQTLELLGVLPFPEGVPYTLKFSSNGTLLLAGGGRAAERGRAVVWNVQTGERVFEVGDELDAVLAADISADQTRIALGGPNRVVRIYGTSDGKLIAELRKHTDWITSVSFSPDGVLLATGDRNGGVFVWEANTAREYLTLAAHTAAITGLSWRADANILASSSEDATIRLWEMENGGNVKGWPAHAGGTSSVEFTRDGRLVSSGRDRAVRLWDQNGAQQRAFPEFSDLALRVTHCDETNRVIAGDWSGAIRVWNAADGAVVGELTSNPQPLVVRLDEATKSVPTRQSEVQKLAEAHKAAQAAADKMQADLAAAQKALADAQKQSDAAAALVRQPQEIASKLAAEKDSAARQIAAIAPLVAPLKDSAEKLDQAVKLFPADKELAAAAVLMKGQFDKKLAVIEEQKKLIADHAAGLEKLKPQLAVAEKQAADAKTAADAAKKHADGLTAQAAPAVKQAAAAKQAADAAAQALAASQLAVARWNGEIEYSKKLKAFAAIENHFNELTAAALAEQANVEKAKADVAAATQKVAAAQKDLDAAAAAVKQAAAVVAQASAVEAQTTQALAALATAAPVLKETLDKLQQALQKAPGDKEIAAAAAALKATFDKKTAELAAGPKTIEARKAEVAKAKEGVAAAEKKAGEMTAALAAIRKAADEKAAGVKPTEDKLAAAKAAADSAKAEVEKAKAALDVPSTLDKARADAGGTSRR